MLKKILTAGLALVLAFSTGCVNKTEVKKTASYEKDVLSSLVSDYRQEGVLTGMSADLCVLPKDGFFDETLLESEYAGLFCETDREVLYAKKAAERIYPASLTKCMTALLVLESVPDLSQKVTVGEELMEGLSDSSSLAGLIPGASYTWKDLLFALLVPSGNDAANTLAFHVSGSVSAFVDRMNEKARRLGMVNTHYVNPHGLHDENHYTTVYDMYLLLNALKDYPVFQECSGQMRVSITAEIPGEEPSVQSFVSGNSYLRGYTVPPEGLHIVAAKTGYTAQAGRCLVLMVLDDEGKRYFAEICRAPSYEALYQQMNQLLSIIGQ